MSVNEAAFRHTMSISEINWHGERTVRFTAGPYEALVLPEVGGNLVSLRDVEKGLDLLRTFPDAATFREKPQVWGIPVLFPPNRIEDGRFTFEGRNYRLPINEPDRNNHLHGFLHTRPWQVESTEQTDQASIVRLVFHATAQSDFFRHFPHEFDFHLTYRLSAGGLEQEVCIRNLSPEPMPMGLGFHTAFRIPFAPDSSPDDCVMQVSIGSGRWEMDKQRMLPTGGQLPLGERDQELLEEGVHPTAAPISAHYVAAPQDGFSQAVITDRRQGLRLVYQVDEKFGFWMLWNGDGGQGFVCPEPQTWLVNAPNVPLPAAETGMQGVSPGGQWRAVSRIRVEEVSGRR